MNKANTTTYKIPEWAISALINCDYSGLSDDDEDNLARFLLTVEGVGHWSLDNDSEPYFSWSNDVTKLGDNVYDVQWVTTLI